MGAILKSYLIGMGVHPAYVFGGTPRDDTEVVGSGTRPKTVIKFRSFNERIAAKDKAQPCDGLSEDAGQACQVHKPQEYQSEGSCCESREQTSPSIPSSYFNGAACCAS
jgi:hypothetical protein